MKKAPFWGLLLCVFLIGAGLWFAGVRVSRLDVNPPVPPPDEIGEMASSPSLLSLSLVMTADEVAALLEKELEFGRYEERDRPLEVPVGEARGDFVVSRDGPVTVRLEEGTIAVNLPLSFASSVRWRGEVLGLRPSFTQEPSGSLVATVFLLPRLDGDGTLHLAPSVKIAWIGEPQLEILGHSVSIGGVASRFLEKQIESRSVEIEARLDEALRTRERLNDLWKRLHRPVELSSEPPLWLDVKPERLYLEPLRVDAGRLELTAGLRCLLAIRPERPEPVDPESLPVDVLGQPPLDGLDFHVPLHLSYEGLRDLISGSLVDNTFELGGGVRLDVRDLALSGGGGFLFAALDVKGRQSLWGLEGTLHLRGRPLWQADDRTLILADFDYDANTTSGLARMASWLAQGVLREKIAERLVFPLGGELDRQREKLAEMLRRSPLGDGFILEAELENLAIEDIYAASTGLIVEARLGGKARIVLEGPLSEDVSR